MRPERRRWGVRARTTLLATVLAGGLLALSAVVLVGATRARIEAAIIEDATERTAELVAIASGGQIEDPLPGPDTELFAQVVDGSGTVIGADRSLTGLGPLPGEAPSLGDRVVTRVETLFDPTTTESGDLVNEGPYVVVAEGLPVEGVTGSVRVAASLEDATDAIRATLPLSVVGIPLLAAAVGLVTWILTGRALRPVEEMRAEAERISGADLHRRLPLPGTADEIESLAVTLNTMLDRLEGSATEMRRFVADASHELKSPLTAMRAMVEVSGREGDTAVDETLMTDLSAEIERMQRLVGDLLYLARLDEAPPRLDVSEVDLDQLVRGEAASLRQRAGLAVDTTGVAPVRVLGDRDRLGQLVRNLHRQRLAPHRCSRMAGDVDYRRFRRLGGQRRRAGDSPGGPGTGLRPLRAARRQPSPDHRGHRSRTGGRPGHRPNPWRRRGGSRATPRRGDLRGALPGRPRCGARPLGAVASHAHGAGAAQGEAAAPEVDLVDQFGTG